MSIEEKTRTAVEKLLSEQQVAVFIVAYNAEKHIEKVIARIPDWVREKLAEIYVIDDSSSDQTYTVAKSLSINSEGKLNIYRTPYNQGYGGNQILGYQHAIEKQHDIVVLLHGDGQYAPEELPNILAPYAYPQVSAVFGSRFLNQGGALAGGMPKYKYIGNRILTWVQNKLLGAKLSEMHSGYRSYRMSNMEKIPFAYNSKGFDFDADIIIQFVEAGYSIVEVPIPTYYGDEICHVNGMQYAWRCVRACAINLLMKVELFYDPKFDLSHLQHNKRYIKKVSPRSLHAYVRNYQFIAGQSILDLGGGDGESVAKDLAQRSFKVTCLDQCEGKSEEQTGFEHLSCDLDSDWPAQLKARRFDACCALDVIEHLKEPEKGLAQLFQVTAEHGTVILSTGNVAFWPIRLMLLLGSFNYGRKGILDLTHKRLFTVRSFQRLVKYQGFDVIEAHGFGVPITDLAPNLPGVKLMEIVSHSLAKLWPGLFAYQILLVCRRPLSHKELMLGTFLDSKR
jgi:glycosyltransferase involved in cell wall biosynthesis